jgi:ribonuclease HI
MKKIKVYTDGSSYPNGPNGAAGAGVVIINGPKVVGFSFKLQNGTNNQAELMAIKLGLEKVHMALQKVPNWEDEVTVEVISDSEYSINSVSGVWSLTPTKKNHAIISNTILMVSRFKHITFKHVRGHTGDPCNEWADRLATAGREGKEGRYETDLNTIPT